MATTVRVGNSDRNMEEVIQNLIKAVEAARADGTNVIHLILPSHPEEVTVPVSIDVQQFRQSTAPNASEDVRNAHAGGKKLGVILITENRAVYGTYLKGCSEVLHETDASTLYKTSMFDMSPADKRNSRREHYAEDVARLGHSLYIVPATGLANIDGLVLAGTAGFGTLVFEAPNVRPSLEFHCA